MKNTVITFVLSLMFVSLCAQGDSRLEGIDATLDEILKVTKAAGFAVAVVEGDKIIYAKGFGYRDYEQKIPVDANTLFAIGSSSKAFTSSVLGQLRNEDKLSFDDRPQKYIPELRFFNTEMNSNISIKDLMCHRTGLPRHDFSWYFFPTDNKDSLLQRIEYQEPFTGLREQWYYNNFMFLAQGVIAERITGESWEENIKSRFFKPLKMTRTNSSIKELEKSTNAAFGYELKKDSVISKMDYYHIAGMSPAGSINSSVNDMSNWLITWINNGKFNGEGIIPPTFVQEAIGSQMVIRGGVPDDEFPDMHVSNYGYAWFISSYRGHYRVEHGGNIDGFAANVAFFPSDSIGIVVLANQNGSAVPSLVRNTIADLLLDGKKTDWSERYKERKDKAKKEAQENKSEATSGKVPNTEPSHILQEYTGIYSHPGYGDFSITLEQDTIFANFKLKKLYLRHHHYDIFEPIEVTNAGIDTSEAFPVKLNFMTNNVGDISSVRMKMEAALDAIEFKREPQTIDVDKTTLDRYVGEYEISGITIKVYTKGENVLFAFVPGQPEYELLATEEHKFAIKIIEGYKLEFIEDENNDFSKVLMIQPNGSFTAIRK